MIRNNKSPEKKEFAASILMAMAQTSLKMAVNSKCMCVYHQPKMPDKLKTLRKF